MEYWDQVLRAEDSINQGMFVFILIMIFFISWLLTLNRNLLMIMNMILSQEAITEENENYAALTEICPGLMKAEA